jgi:hypothetical protein
VPLTNIHEIEEVKTTSMKKFRVVIIGVVICILIILVVPYLRVEVLTWKHGTEFETLYKSSNILDDIDYFKVMNYSDTSARVYYVAKNRARADLFTFVQKDGQWVLDKWKTIWSKTGSADDFIWPYYR